MKKSNIILIIYLFLIIITISCSLFYVNAKEQQDISTSVDYYSLPKEDIEKRNMIHKQELDLPEIKAYEEDLDGNITEVTPLNQRERGVPDHYYEYVFDDVDLTDVGTVDRYYSLVGTYCINNRSDISIRGRYQQEERSTVESSLTSNLELESEAGVKFLANLKAKVGFQVSLKYTFSSGRVDEEAFEVPPKTKVEISKYVGAVKANGKIRYKKYTPGHGSWIGYYYEDCGGWIVAPNRITYDTTSGPADER